MQTLNRFLHWVTSHLALLIAAILIAVQLWWLELAPPGGRSEQILAVFLLALFVIVFVLALRAKHPALRIPAIAFAISFLGLHVIYDASYLPSIQTAARFHGTTYLVTSNPEFLGWGIPYYQFVEWKSPLQYKVHDLGYRGWWYRISYDAGNNIVNLVDSKLDDKLVYWDDGTFRRFQGDVEVGSDRYYASALCKTWEPYICVTTVYSLYRCRPDNTSCVLLPMTYIGEDGYVTLRHNETSDNIDFYLTPNSATTDIDILIYSYGKEPRCYVAGCSVRP
jgi:hypothetical protein